MIYLETTLMPSIFLLQLSVYSATPNNIHVFVALFCITFTMALRRLARWEPRKNMNMLQCLQNSGSPLSRNASLL